MSRPTYTALCAAWLIAGCKVEPTPQQYFDHQNPIVVERAAAAEELQARLMAMGQALNRNNLEEAFSALAPSADVHLVTQDASPAAVAPEQVSALLARVVAERAPVRVDDVRVSVGARANIAWFYAGVYARPGVNEPPLRVTGVFLRGDEGEWRLVQAHFSTPTPQPSPPPPNPDAAGTPPAGGSEPAPAPSRPDGSSA